MQRLLTLRSGLPRRAGGRPSFPAPALMLHASLAVPGTALRSRSASWRPGNAGPGPARNRWPGRRAHRPLAPTAHPGAGEAGNGAAVDRSAEALGDQVPDHIGEVLL